MLIKYDPDEGLIVAVSIEEPDELVRATEALIEAFGADCDVSFLRHILETAKADLKHTLQ